MFDTRIEWHAKHSESKELASGFLLPFVSSDFRPFLREDILYVVTRCPHAAPRRLKIFSRRTSSSLSKMSSCVGCAAVFSRAHSGIFDFFSTLDMLVRFWPEHRSLRDRRRSGRRCFRRRSATGCRHCRSQNTHRRRHHHHHRRLPSWMSR